MSRRSNSLGKGHLRHGPVDRLLVRTNSWSQGLDRPGAAAGPVITAQQQVAADEQPACDEVIEREADQHHQERPAPVRSSMRRMVRFRMSSGPVVDPAPPPSPDESAPSTSSAALPTGNEGLEGRASSRPEKDGPAEGEASQRRPPATTDQALPASAAPPISPAAAPAASHHHQQQAQQAAVSPISSVPVIETEPATRSDSVNHQPSSAAVSSVRWTEPASSPNRQVLVRQVSRFSVVQTPTPLDGTGLRCAARESSPDASQPQRHQPLGPSLSALSAASQVSQLSQVSQMSQVSQVSSQPGRRRRDRGSRHHRDAASRTHSRARRQRSNMSAASGVSRASSGDTTVTRRRRNRDNVDPEEESRRKLGGIWPHSMSPMFALLAATLGLFNVSRFAVLSIEYGGNFIVQFILLTFLFGVPILCFHGCLGQFLGSNVIDVWRISPIFKGVGIALLVGQAVIGVYSIIGIAWLFFYFRDSFIAQEDSYKWSKCNTASPLRRCELSTNYSSIEATVPNYFHTRVLQRVNTTTEPTQFNSLKFELIFNLVVIWMIIFVVLGKGLRSYGKLVYVFGTVPILGYFAICVKVLGYGSTMATNGIPDALESTPWSEFILDTRVWVVAAREVFMTWGLCGAVVMQITSHNRYSHSLRRDITVVIGLTLFVLTLTGFFACTCLQIIKTRGHLDIVDSSFETEGSYGFLRKTNPQHLSTMPHGPDYFHSNFMMGIAVRRDETGQFTKSGYMPLRLTTELFPALVASLKPHEFSPFWAVLFYFSLVAIGLAQQLAIWHCVISGIVAFRACCLKSWETTITFCTCAAGFMLSLPFATEMGIAIVYHLDYAIGSLWWIMIVYVVQIAAVLIVRGRPYNAESIVAVLIKEPGCLSNWAVPMLTFSWSVVLPIGLLVLSVSTFKTGNFCDMFNWAVSQGYAFWPLWARQAGTMIQLVPILLIPTVGIIQCFRYLTSGPPDLFERIKLLYRPHFRTYLIPHEPASRTTSRSSRPSQHGRDRRRSGRSRSRSRSPSPAPATFPDPPPKYTPPPTYNTATGARIAKMFRESIRRSFRQIRDMTTPVHSPGNTLTSMADMELGRNASRDGHQQAGAVQLPPDYTSVILEMHDNTRDHCSPSGSNESDAASSSQSIDTGTSSSSSSSSSDSSGSSLLSPAELTRLLRDSFRRSARNTLRNSLRFLRGEKASNPKPASPTSARSATDDEETTDTDQGTRQLVNGAVRIHRDPSLPTIVVTLPNSDGDHSESVA